MYVLSLWQTDRPVEGIKFDIKQSFRSSNEDSNYNARADGSETLMHAHLTEQNCHQVQVRRSQRPATKEETRGVKKMSAAGTVQPRKAKTITGGGDDGGGDGACLARLHYSHCRARSTELESSVLVGTSVWSSWGGWQRFR